MVKPNVKTEVRVPVGTPSGTVKEMKKDELKIVSGGQTGVDRGALQAAMDLGLDWGGWAPKGWRSEDGTIPPHYRTNMQDIVWIGESPR